MTLKIGSLFTGYGGLDQAVTQVTGAETVWVSDIDKGACKILAHRYPTIPNLGDITTVDWTKVEPIDILTGGFPCQDVSHAGKRAGLKEGTRSGLWSHMAEAIQALQPRLVVIENVRGLLSAPSPSSVEPCPWCVGDEPTFDLRALGTVLSDLADIGFDARWCGLRAADVGACHGRFRVFLIAYPKGNPWRVSDRDDWTSSHSDNIGSERSGFTWSGGTGLKDGNPRSDVTLLPTPMAAEGTKPSNVMGVERRLETGQVFLTNVIVTLAGLDPSENNLLSTPMSRDYKGSGTGRLAKSLEKGHLEAQIKMQFGDYAPAIARWEELMGRQAPQPTQMNSKSGREKLSAPFVEWMMGLPLGWVTDVSELSWAEQLKALGNGVVPQQASVALRHLMGGL
jgi:DNA (cytosine-5)-methyltransferase 1